MASKPGRAASLSGTNFLPHHEPMMMSGAAAMTASGVTMRSVADFFFDEFRKDIDAAGDLDQFRHPADAGDHRLVPFLEIDARLCAQRRMLAPACRKASS